MIVVTGASGQLGHLVVQNLLQKLPAHEIVAAVRNPEKAKDLLALGVQVRKADYDLPETLVQAFRGADKLLLVSSSEVGKRFIQHRAVIDAARKAGVKLVVYTSILHADTSPLGLAAEHKQTEDYLKASGVAYVLLRNGWYTQNYTASIPPALQHGAFLGSAGSGRIASATRADYALAAAAVLLKDKQPQSIYELAGDAAYTLTELVAEISRQSGKNIVYKNLPEAEYKAALVSAGFPEPVAGIFSESDTGAAKGGLFDDSHTLSQLIGRPTTPLSAAVAEALKA